MSVEYREIPGHIGYRVGNDGSVWSCWRHGPNSVMIDEWRQLKPSKGKRGHLRVTLARPEITYCLVHQLVLLAFVGPCPEGMECCHFPDRNPANNSLTNLRYATRQDNYRDSQIHGTAVRGERHGRAKANEPTIRSVRADHSTGNYSSRELAKKHQLSQKTILNIIHAKNWKHVT